MKGRNRIEMNIATMIEAVQMYLDAQYRDGLSPIVTSITATGGTITVFRVDTKDREPDTTARTT